MASLPLRIARGARALTLKQKLALCELAEHAGEVLREDLTAETRRVVSSLIPWGYVAGRELRARRTIRYRLTDGGRAAAAEVAGYEKLRARQLAKTEG